MKHIYKWNEKHSLIFTNFVKKLNDARINFFVLRNYEGLPDCNSSKDIDIILEPKEYKRALNLLIETFRSLQIKYYYVMDYERAHCVYGMNPDIDLYIHIDLIQGYANKGYEIFSFEELYNNTIQYNDFRVLNSHFDAVMLLLYKVIGCKELKEAYRLKIKDIYTSKSKEINTILFKVLGNKCFNVVKDCLDRNDFDDLVSKSFLINNSAKKRAFFKKPIMSIVGWFKFYWEKFYNIVWCPQYMQKMIAVEAPDGTGKTTFIEALKLKIAESFVSDISKSRVFHFRPEFLPNLGAAGEKMKVMKQDKDFSNPHRAKPVGKINSFVRMTYYWLDYIIGVPIIIHKSAQFDKITIFDRYIYDFLVDPRRSRINLPYSVRRLFTKLVKQPKIVFVLDAPAEVIYKRKQELTVEEITRQLGEFRKLSYLGKRYYRLDASRRPEDMANDAIKVILENFTIKL